MAAALPAIQRGDLEAAWRVYSGTMRGNGERAGRKRDFMAAQKPSRRAEAKFLISVDGGGAYWASRAEMNAINCIKHEVKVLKRQ